MNGRIATLFFSVPVDVTVMMSGADDGGFDIEGVYCDDDVDSAVDFPVNQFNARLKTPPST